MQNSTARVSRVGAAVESDHEQIGVCDQQEEAR
jgi:hypothetical protein